MTVPSTIGSAVLIQSSSNINQSVTVPSGADTCLMLGGGWDSGGNTVTATLGGDSFTQIELITADSNDQAFAYYLNTPSSGSQTLVVTYGSSWTEGASVYLVFFQDVDTGGSPVRDSATVQSEFGTATTPSFSTDTNDLVVATGTGYTGVGQSGCDTGVSGQSEILSNDYNDAETSIGTKAGSAGTTTASASGDYVGLVGLSLKGSVAGGLSIPVAMHHYRQQGAA